MAVLITGCGGQLGTELCNRLGVNGMGVDVTEIDLTHDEQIRDGILNRSPTAVINTAAYTAVDLAEEKRDLCHRINASAVQTLATTTAELAIPLVQISTDYVFGDVPQTKIARRESDSIAPQGEYAKSKAAGEEAARINPQHFVVRTCGLYGLGGPTAAGNFVKTMLRLGESKGFVSVVNDQECTPTWIPELASAVLFLLQTSEFGTYHVTNQGATTWFDMTKEIFRQAKLNCEVRPITTAQFGAAAPRPSYSVLDTSKYHALGGPTMSPWQDALAGFLRQLNRA